MKRLIREESGMAMGLAVVMIALIGVMGAGLLVFVRNDLEAVVEVNRGQKAMDIAEAGVQAAKRQLLSDANRRHYDKDFSNDCGSAAPGDDPRIGDDWSPGPNLANDDCSSSTAKTSIGVTKNFAGGRFTVTIQCFDQPGDVGDVCAGIDESSPETVEASNRAFFKVTSTGYYPADGSGAKRRVEAIFSTVNLGVPKAYFTPNNINVRGTAEVTDVSLFSLGNVNLYGGATVRGEDKAYLNWKNSFNPTPRPTTAAGIGAAGTISGRVANRDYDSATCPKFVKDLAESSSCSSPGRITFPFDYKTQQGQQDQNRIDFLREEAKTNGVYYSSSGGNVYVGDSGDDVEWPADATSNTVVFIEYTSAGGTNKVTWRPGNDCNDPPLEGTLVVYGGDFTLNQHTTPFKGVVIVRGGVYEEGESVDAGGNTCLNGFVNASGDIEIKGNVEPLATEDVVRRPGFYGVRLWSWRELYG